MDPLTLVLVIVIIIVLLGGWRGRTYVGANGGDLLYVLGVLLIVFVLLRLLHIL